MNAEKVCTIIFHAHSVNVHYKEHHSTMLENMALYEDV